MRNFKFPISGISLVRTMLPTILLLSDTAAFAAAQDCERFPEDYSVSGPLSLQEVEKKSLDRILNSQTPRVPQVPFGYSNDSWVRFKSGFREGDILVKYSSSPASWENMGGRQGYARMRDGCVLSKMLGIRN